ncbi:hypothetical protein [Nucisporomicrobium flavum]|uniref:hypothetical protein n=1 Tax=Nucisporomicrobium flavum TaxID=2785915 RepID=UPI0018F41FCC|nr:hypothetical protein [Nucisporomicrobium flavum]
MRYPGELEQIVLILQQVYGDVIVALMSQPSVIRYLVYATIAVRLVIALLRFEQQITRLLYGLRNRHPSCVCGCAAVARDAGTLNTLSVQDSTSGMGAATTTDIAAD